MNTVNLQTFLLLCELQNFTRTAEQMFVAQSTVTNRIADMERELDRKLFIRGKKSLQLTHEGELYKNFAREILALEKGFLQKLDTAATYERTLRVGAAYTIYEGLLRELYRFCYLPEVNVSLSLRLTHSTTLLHQLQSKQLDLVFSYFSLQSAGYVCRQFHSDELLLVTSGQNRQFEDGVRREDLARLDYLMNDFALQAAGIFVRELFPPHHAFRFETSNGPTLLPILLSGVGYSFLPSCLVRECLADGSLISIPLLDFSMPCLNSYYTYRSNDTLCEQAISFLQRCQAVSSGSPCE